jgi:phytoene dehydrogenase-like protein
VFIKYRTIRNSGQKYCDTLFWCLTLKLVNMKKKITIISDGIAGLSAGIYSAMNGFDTEIFEMHNIAGGQCTAWERKKHRFDYCLHWLAGTSKGAFHDIWK